MQHWIVAFFELNFNVVLRYIIIFLHEGNNFYSETLKESSKWYYIKTCYNLTYFF